MIHETKKVSRKPGPVYKNALRELLDEGLIEAYRGAIYRLTPQGVERAKEILGGD